MHLNSKQLSIYAKYLTRQLESILISPTLLHEVGTQRQFKHVMMSALMDLHTGVSPTAGRNLTRAVRSDLVKKSRDVLLACEQDTVTVLDLCKRLRVSRRTLQSSFLDVTGVTPSAYLRALRLNEVRRLLQKTPADALTIGDAASKFCFFHLSHFAADYRKLFGELPSQTTRSSS
jgi:AraC family ethanolamine operon transcriptional activator